MLFVRTLRKRRKFQAAFFTPSPYDLLDNTLCHLAEGWADREVLQGHLQSARFQEALTKVLDTVRLLDRQGLLYTVSGEGPIVPVKQ